MAPQQPGNRKQLDDEITEFLRRAAQRRSQGGQGGASTPLAPAPQPARAPQRRQQPPQPKPQPQTAREEPRVRTSVAEHVQQNVDSRDISDHADQIGQVAQRVHRLESHVQQAFDHEVGHLAQQADANRPVAAALPVSRSAADLVSALLAEPDGIRNAIILAEVLQRPEHRW